MVTNLPTTQETGVQSLGREDPLEKEMATHSSIPAWNIPWTEEPGGLQSMGSHRVEYHGATHIQTDRKASQVNESEKLMSLRWQYTTK